MKIKANGSSIVEYTLLIVIVIAALISMGIFIKRSLEGNYREVGLHFSAGRQAVGWQ